MKYTKEERSDIGCRIYTGKLSRYEASEKYDTNINTARDYMRLYRDTHDLPSNRDDVPKLLRAHHPRPCQ